jgi:hypothetical protein
MEFAMNHEIERVKIVVYPDGRLDSENAARFLGFSPKTLAMMRTAGTGPKFVKRGRVFYSKHGSASSRVFGAPPRRE